MYGDVQMRRYLDEILTLLGSEKKRLPGILLLFLLSSLLDLAGIGLIGPYVSMVASPGNADDVISRNIDMFGIVGDSDRLLVIMGLFLVGVFLVKAIVAIWINYVIVRFDADQQIRLRSVLMSSYMSMPYAEYLGRNSSDCIHSTQTMVAHYANGVVNTLLRVLSDSIVAIAILVLLAWTNWLALLILVGLMGVFLIFYDTLFRKNIRIIGEKANCASTDMVQAIHEGIEGLKEIRILGHENHFQTRVDEAASDYGKYNVKSSVLGSAPRYLLEFIMMLFVVLLIVMTVVLDQQVEQLLPTLGMFGVAAIRLLPAANSISGSMMRLRFYRDSVARLHSDVTTTSIEQTPIATGRSNQRDRCFEELSLRGVCFCYPKTKRDVLHQIDMDIKRGESIGIIGSSGSGKTTLIDTLLGLLEPQQGSIFYNGSCLDDSLASWRRHVAYLPQQVFLIDNTLRRNVALGISSDDIDEQRLAGALEKARLSKLVQELPDGVETMLGERGVRLSGGQRQRIALARTFYHERNVLIMDESTSALDSETEREIVDEIRRWKGEKTIIVIAHRLTTIQHCDRIYRLENGQIVASGTPKEMLHELS